MSRITLTDSFRQYDSMLLSPKCINNNRQY